MAINVTASLSKVIRVNAGVNPAHIHEPVAIVNSDLTYNESAEPGTTHELPDVEHTDTDGTPVSLPAITPMLCSPADDGIVNINGEQFATVAPGATFEGQALDQNDVAVGEVESAGLLRVVIPDPAPSFKGVSIYWKETAWLFANTHGSDYEIPIGSGQLTGDIPAADHELVGPVGYDPATQDVIAAFYIKRDPPNSAVEVFYGTPASPGNALPPASPGSAYFLAAHVIREAGQSQPGVNNILVYDENVGLPTEWNFSVIGGGTVDFAAVANPHPDHGPLHIRARALTAGQGFKATYSAPFLWENISALLFEIDPSSWSGQANRKLDITIRLAGAQQGSTVSLFNGQFGFNSSGPYQTTGVAGVAWNIPSGVLVDEIWFVRSGPQSISFDMDFKRLQGTIPTGSPVACDIPVLSCAELNDDTDGLTTIQRQEIQNVYVLKTGQTDSLDTGDDGDTQRGRQTDFFTLSCANPNGNTDRFEDNGDGTVTDWATGLMWSQVPLQPTPSNKSFRDYLTEVGVSTLGGHTDWQIPNYNEFMSLMHYGAILGQVTVLDYPPFDMDSQGQLHFVSTATANSGGGLMIVIQVLPALANIAWTVGRDDVSNPAYCYMVRQL